MPTLRVLISGAGIAGNALAFWLAKLGHDVTVVERYPELRTTGLQIDLRGYGIDILKLMGLEKAFREHATPEVGVEFVDTSGKRWGYFPANTSGKGAQGFTSEFEIMRGDFCRIMYEAVKDKVRYVFGTSIESFEEKGDGLEVRFADGQVDRFDLLVGCDGKGSRTRRQMLGPDVPDVFRQVNDCVAYFIIDEPVQKEERYIGKGYMAPGGRFVMTRRHNADQMQVYLMGNGIAEKLKDVRRGDVTGEKEALIELFKGAGWRTDEILELMKSSDNFYCERQGVAKLQSWSKGRVTLAGDAVSCQPANGLGTTYALVGAYILAGEISTHCGPDIDREAATTTEESLKSALKAYQDKLQPILYKMQEGAGETNILDKISWTPLVISICYWMIWLASLSRVDRLAGMFFNDRVKGWDLPKYNELPTYQV